jgi:hypothetical protein
MKWDTVLEAVASCAALDPTRVALVHDGEEWSYRQLWALINLAVDEIDNAKLPAQACVAVVARKSPATIAFHIASPELKELVGGDVFLHWYNEVKINGTWLQVAPVFNKLLCKLYNLQPLEFDGFNSSLHQQYNSQSTMQYIGSAQKFDEPTHEEIIQLVREFHPNMVTELQIVPDFSNGNRMAACSAAGVCS